MKNKDNNKKVKKIKKTKFIIFTDIDGTLNLEDKKLNRIFQIIKEAGGEVIAVSGRTVGDIAEEFGRRNLELPNFIVGDNGGCIYDTRKKEFIERKTLEKEKICKVIKHYIQIGGDKNLIRYTDGNNVYASDDKDVKKYYKKKKTVKISDNIDKKIIEANDITKITLAGSEKEMEEMTEFVREIGFWTDMGKTKFPQKEQNNQRLDIAPKNTNKGAAIKSMIEYLKPEWGYACYGNGWNDLTMFEKAIKDGMRVFIMEDAPEKLKSRIKKEAKKSKRGKVYELPNKENKANRKIEKMARLLKKKKEKEEYNELISQKRENRLPNLPRIKVKPIRHENKNIRKSRKKSFEER